MIVNVRGISGSGKSYVGRALRAMAIRDCTVPVGHPLNQNKTRERVIGYELPGSLCVLGRYESEKGGGLEGIKPRTNEREFVRQAAGYYRHVFFEGMQLSFTFGPWIELAEELARNDAPALPFVVLVMDTPYEKCIERIYSRNGGNQINEPFHRKNYRELHDSVVPALRKSDAIAVEYVDHTRAVEDVIAWFASAGWSRDTQAA